MNRKKLFDHRPELLSRGLLLHQLAASLHRFPQLMNFLFFEYMERYVSLRKDEVTKALLDHRIDGLLSNLVFDYTPFSDLAEVRDENGNTPVHIWCKTYTDCSVKDVKLLWCLLYVSPNYIKKQARNAEGKTPLDYARERRLPGTVLEMLS